jgi:hypothetical protein
LVRDEWDLSYVRAAEACESGMNNFIIIGHPGVGANHISVFSLGKLTAHVEGKTLSLYYILSIRLATSMATFFQKEPDEVWYFDERGIRRIPHNTNWADIPGIDRSQAPWALVDSNFFVTHPAPVLCSNESPFFIVEAASPRERRWTWSKYHGNTLFFYTHPFSLIEMFQGTCMSLSSRKLSPTLHEGNSLQLEPVEQNRLRDFFYKYGPSARSCYNATASDYAHEMYVQKVDQAVGTTL